MADIEPAAIGPASFAWVADPAGNARRLSLANAERVRHSGQLLWVHVDGRDAACRHWLEADAHIPDTVAEALEAYETRPRATPLEHGALVNLRGLAADHDPDADALASVRLWAEHGRVLTVSFRPLAAINDVGAEMAAGRIRDPGDLIAALAEAITERLDPVVADLGDKLDDLETEFARGDLEIRQPLGELRRLAVEYRRFLLPQRDAIVRLTQGDFRWLEDDDRVHIREAAERAQRMAEELDAIRERAGVLADQLTDLRSDLANQRMLVLSIVAAIFLPLTFLTGLLGMNVRGIPYAQAKYAFATIVGLSVLIAAGMLIWFRRRRWI